jgi:GT2 family glycosyltransferase
MTCASVVVPTFNRLPDLKRVVAAIRGQRHRPDDGLDLVVVDDGSTDGTTQWLRAQQSEDRLRVVVQGNSGPAAARNRGAEAARGDILMFLGDDTEPAQGWFAAHLEQHRIFGASAAPLAVVGYTGFPEDHDSPFLRFINEYGAQFGYALIDEPGEVPFNFFYTSNVSLPTTTFRELGGFREDFSAAAWEDIEFAYRASREGMRLRYQPLARTVHHHRIRPRTFCNRQRTSGQAAAVFAGLHPELEAWLGVPRARDTGRRSGLSLQLLHLAVALGEHLPGGLPLVVYQKYLDAAYLGGLAEALQADSA